LNKPRDRPACQTASRFDGTDVQGVDAVTTFEVSLIYLLQKLVSQPFYNTTGAKSLRVHTKM